MAYAWHDAVCDHAGGESVYGEMFNAALESAAFVISNRDTLLDLGLSVIPEDCLTARAIRKARECHAAGMAWREARDTVMEFAYNINAQYSPINLGFQTIGWLYGEDFGDALRKAVNCGWDTDCTGATLGAILGIIHGASALPEKWLAPLGRKLAITPEPGIINFKPPKDVDELADRTIAIGRQVLAKHHPRVQLGTATTPIAGRRCAGGLRHGQGGPRTAAERGCTIASVRSTCLWPIPSRRALPWTARLRLRSRCATAARPRWRARSRWSSAKAWNPEPPRIQEYRIEGRGEHVTPRITLRVKDAASVPAEQQGVARSGPVPASRRRGDSRRGRWSPEMARGRHDPRRHAGVSSAEPRPRRRRRGPRRLANRRVARQRASN